MNRPRNRQNKGLPLNLYRCGKNAYRYIHPVTHRQHGMGTNRAQAIQAANLLNAKLMPPNDLVSKVTAGITVDEYASGRYQNEILAERRLAPSTIKVYEGLTRQIAELFKGVRLFELTTLVVANALNELPPKKANKLRSHLANILKEAIADGLIENNAALTTRTRVTEKNRNRMTLKQFYAVHAQAPTWMQNAMDIGLLTLQRRSDILEMRFDNIKDGNLYVIQQKTKKHDTGYLKIAISPQLSMIINRCRDNIPSPYLIHHRPTRGRRQDHQKDHWSQVARNTFTRVFDQARTATGLFDGWEKGTLPSFHEIRALGIKLYKDQNIDPQQLAGHASNQMTKNYDSGHDDIRWMEVEACLTLKDQAGVLE